MINLNCSKTKYDKLFLMARQSGILRFKQEENFVFDTVVRQFIKKKKKQSHVSTSGTSCVGLC